MDNFFDKIKKLIQSAYRRQGSKVGRGRNLYAFPTSARIHTVFRLFLSYDSFY